MSIFSVVLFHRGGSWHGAELELEEDVATIDDIADRMRDAALAGDVSPDGETMLLLIEADDEWFGIVRVDGHEEPRVFLSDSRVMNDYTMAALLVESGGMTPPEQVEGTGQKPHPTPGGDRELLGDLGVTEAELTALTASEGTLPGDALTSLAEQVGFDEVLEPLRFAQGL
ncbi:putative tRNA adenosine deaminase-associated protein [Haloactinospora alba]|uniref:Putative tRNA adenosine deaminase-associated protein n=1 Tax=Haloactinospora alba TaxID=405555 RepID=A0A543N9N5_9ACTN|nr:tRNA adenosine deaminase-associated protein [Haloactinospora alba]TQN28554.1 putative tRNA adenosine deaminase-associated protein [Haloactinospora alba]